MTNEEALKILKYRSGWNLSIRDVNALDMAIKALERESQTFDMKFKHCSMCGAKMFKPQESEGKE